MITILVDRWLTHPLAWIHRAEARTIGAELRAMGEDVRMTRFTPVRAPAGGTLLLRLSDPAMLDAIRALSDAGVCYCGPGAEVMTRCYDKARAYALARSHGVACPETILGSDAAAAPRPLLLKPRQGSDSLGLRLLRSGPIPAACRNEDYLAQSLICGTELTVGVLGNDAGMPLHIELPAGVPYAFWRKYLWPPRKTPLADAALAQRARAEALRIARIFQVDWAVRIDMIHERHGNRLVFLECDAAPLLGPSSAFAASMAAAGTARETQLRRLLSMRPALSLSAARL